MSRKSKGINAERSLIHKFWQENWCAVRIAGSGSCRYPSPDILAGNNLRKLAIECKTSKDSAKYLTSKEIQELLEFSKLFGAEAWIAIKFDKLEWYFLTTEDLNRTESHYVITAENAKNKGLLFSELLG
ncbi:Holliday junction resolvase [Candidatus Woesearchaeota archaeon]|nr:Holliday junction resolvase [Candidatus Woesearchaeota archaeon]